MSLRAIKKRENQINSNGGVTAPKQTIFRKANTCNQQQLHLPRKYSNALKSISASLNSKHRLKKQYQLLGRNVQSNPELRSGFISLEHHSSHLVRTKSENDIATLLKSCAGNGTDANGRGLFGAKSEVSLQTIASHNYTATNTTIIQQQQPQQSASQPQLHGSPLHSHEESVDSYSTMISGGQIPRTMTQSSYTNTSSSSSSPGYDTTTSSSRRRMSESSLQSNSTYSPRTSARSGSAMTLSSMSDPNTAVRVPIIGYEVMEERARFTVYKLRVENPVSNDCWLVMRRYTDFVRLNSKLKQIFPHISLILPRKKIFGDNFNSVFLDNRVQGLQMFVNSIMAKEELRKCKFVREFFCLDEPPTYSESMEECRAIFEAQEETIAHLKLQISNKNDLILTLQQKLRLETAEKEALKEALKNVSHKFAACNAATSNGSMASN